MIQDSEGHHLTHNGRPIQPLGNRDVYFVTPYADENNSPVTETSEILDNREEQKTRLEDLNERPSHDLDSNVYQENNDNSKSKTEQPKKIKKHGKNKSTNVSFTNFLFMICTILLTIVY